MKRKFYIFLCMLLGVILLLIIQRALLAIYVILAGSNSAYDLLTVTQLQTVNWLTVGVAVLIGLVYGNFLGHHWYPLVYGSKRGSRSGAVETSNKPAAVMDPVPKTVTIKPVRAARAKVSLRSEVKEDGWDFDDLLNHDAPAVESLGSSGPSVASAVSLGESEFPKPAAKPAVKKTAVRKSAPRKTAVSAKPAKPATKPAAKKSVAKSNAKSVAKPAVKKTATKVNVK